MRYNTICKEECGSMNTVFHKYKKYEYRYYSHTEVKVYHESGKHVFFFAVDFKEYFFTVKELRKEKLKIIYEKV